MKDRGENKMRLVFRMLVIASTISLSSIAARAEEGLTGHYFPGALSSSLDLLPALPPELPAKTELGYTIGYANDSTYYHGSTNHLGSIPTSANATSYTDTSVFLCQFPGQISILPGKPQYSVALAVPYTWFKVHAQGAKDTDNGFGDVEMFPMMLNWTKYEVDPETYKYTWQNQMEFGIYAPTGNFESGAPANLGKNYWTFEPSAATGYSLAPHDWTQYSLQLTASAGFDFNTKNGATHYQTGDEFHLDGTLAAYRTLSEGAAFVGAGVSGFFYQQITGDSGSGAKLGSFEAMTTGVGPDLSYISIHVYENENFTMGGELKWLPELSVSNRLKGNIVWLKLVFTWGTFSKKSFEAITAPNVRALYAIPSL